VVSAFRVDGIGALGEDRTASSPAQVTTSTVRSTHPGAPAAPRSAVTGESNTPAATVGIARRPAALATSPQVTTAAQAATSAQATTTAQMTTPSASRSAGTNLHSTSAAGLTAPDSGAPAAAGAVSPAGVCPVDAGAVDARPRGPRRQR
jgi:hypothetical protein